MAVFPKIQSPCPYKGNLTEILDGDTCRLCRRRVFDLSGMDDKARIGFLAGCKEEVCVTYRAPAMVAAAALAAAAAVSVPVAAAAQDTAPIEEWVITGGIKDPSKVEFVRDAADKDTPPLPVVYEDSQSAKPANSPAGS